MERLPEVVRAHEILLLADALIGPLFPFALDPTTDRRESTSMFPSREFEPW